MKQSFKFGMLAGLASLALVAAQTPAEAAPFLDGTFGFEIYQGDTNSGNINSPTQQAVLGNPLIAPANLIATGTYTGAFNFFAGTGAPNNIDFFLESGGGDVDYLSGDGSQALSSGGFDVTTVMKFTFGGDPFTYLGSVITHDDGMSIYDSLLAVIASSPLPTVAIPTGPFNYGGAWTLVYVAANDLPEVLRFEYETRSSRIDVPLPAALPLLIAGLGGLGVLGRMRRRKVAA